METSKEDLLIRANIDPDHCKISSTEEYYIIDGLLKLNVLGQHFALIHSQNGNLGTEALKNLVNSKIDKIKEEIDEDKNLGITLTSFTDEKTSCYLTSYLDYFTNYLDLVKIFRKLNNKRSSGPDKIPNVVLKNIPALIIQEYCIIFNNVLNHTYFPDKWKKADVIAIK